MTASSWIYSYGVHVSLEGTERVRLDGLERLEEDSAEKIIEFARRNKSRLLTELRSKPVKVMKAIETVLVTPDGHLRCKHCVNHSVVCICSGPCTAKGMIRDPDCFACHAFLEKFPRQVGKAAYWAGDNQKRELQ